MKLPFTQESLLAMSHKLKDEMLSKFISKNGKPVGLQLCRQLLCQAMTHKPYEEIKALLSAPENVSASSAVAKVYLLSYEQEIVLAIADDAGKLSLQYIRDRGTGSDIELTIEALKMMADTYAHTLHSRVVAVDLPPVLGEDWDFDKIIDLANRIGYGQQEETLLDKLECLKGPVFVGNLHAYYGISDDWRSQVAECAENMEPEDDFNDDPFDHVVWYFDIEVDSSRCEFEFTLSDLLFAKKADTDGVNQSWVVNSEDEKESVIITLYHWPSNNAPQRK